MDKMDKKVYVQILVLLLIPAFPLSTKAIATLYVDPATTMTSVSDTFSINITISDVIDLAGWEFKLYYLSSNLNGTNLEEGPFLKQGGPTYFDPINFTDDYNSTHGIAWATCTLLGAGPGVNGNGTLAILTLKAKELGTSSLSLADTWLSDSQSDPQPIPHTALNGIVYVLPHDVAITNLTTSKTVVGQGLTVKINVDIFNQGNFTETFNVTVYASTTIIGTLINVTLASGNSTTVTVTWNTTGFAKGNYTIWAYAWPVPGETDTIDNTLNYGVVTVTIPGDVDGTFDVDIFDVVKITSIYATKLGDPRFKPNSDIDDDGVITIFDVVMCTSHYGQKYP